MSVSPCRERAARPRPDLFTGRGSVRSHQRSSRYATRPTGRVPEPGYRTGRRVRWCCVPDQAACDALRQRIGRLSTAYPAR
jgi:hypothetical protein